MNELEMRILEVLTDDARTPVKQIAVMLGRGEEEVAAAIRGGATLVHGVQMKNIVKKLEL